MMSLTDAGVIEHLEIYYTSWFHGIVLTHHVHPRTPSNRRVLRDGLDHAQEDVPVQVPFNPLLKVERDGDGAVYGEGLDRVVDVEL